MCGFRLQALFVNAANAPAGDGFCALKTEQGNGIREIHQYKFTKDKAPLPAALFNQERAKAASEEDFFIMFSLFDDFQGTIPDNSALVCKSNFKNYYGPFAGRAFYMTDNPPPHPNKASRSQLETVHGIGPASATKILANRPYKSLQECQAKTALSIKVLEQLNWGAVNNEL